MRALLFVFLLFSFIPAAIAAEEYICPMHPHIVGEKGDSCPICGMTLVPKVADIPQSSEPEKPDNQGNQGNNDSGEFRIDPSYVETLGVKTQEVMHHEFGKEIRAYGKIVPDSRTEYAVDVRIEGWIVDLPVSAVGDSVKRGDLLFTYYSPDLMSAQTDFLVGSRTGGSEQRLRLYGMGDKAIDELKTRKKSLEAAPFYAPVNGIVTMLNVSKGAHVKEGGSILKLQDFSTVWINADVPVKDAQFLKTGTPAIITIPETGAQAATTVDLIHPVNDPNTRTVPVRLILDNPEGTLKPETYVDVEFNADKQSRLAVPEEAILYNTAGAYVFENVADGRFRPVNVHTGITADGLTEIKSGLSHGQRIVTSGQFMLDAESNLRAGMGKMEKMDTMDHSEGHHHAQE